MNELSYDTERPIAALATPWGRSAVAVIRTAGSGTIEKTAAIFSRPGALRRAESHSMVFGHLLDADGKRLEQVLLGVFRAPGGYTGQESIEIYTHGSPTGISRILDRLYACGFHPAAPGEFTMRAFLSGKLDLTEAEAVAGIIDAKSARAHQMAMERLSGSLFERIDRLKQQLVTLLSSVEVVLDYPEDELMDAADPDFSLLEALQRDLKDLAASFRGGRLYKEGAKIALSGRTNAGKSSLFNLFLREDRSIVSEIHGTTRDYIESWLSVEGIPVQLFDTAGLRSADHPVEEEGIRRSGEVVESADLVLYLFDGEQRPEQGELDLLEQERGRGERSRYLFLLTKSDRDIIEEPWNRDLMRVSSKSGEGFRALQGELVSRLQREAPLLEGDVSVDSRRQKLLLDRAIEALARVSDGLGTDAGLDEIAMDLKEALDALGEITGEVTSADILHSIFSDFCLGK